MTTTAPAVRTVAVCIDTRSGPGRNRLLGVARHLRLLGWRMLLTSTAGKAAAQEAVEPSPDGIVAFCADRWLIAAARRRNIPLVDTAIGDHPVSMSVSLDADGVGRLAAEHFLQAGFRHFAYAGMGGRFASTQRRTAFARHIGTHPLAIFQEPGWLEAARLNTLVRWLEGLPKPVGLLAFDDLHGERILCGCRAAGLAVPGQVAVLGIGDDEVMCEVSWPSLSSLRLPTRRIGWEAARMLAQVIAHQRPKDLHITIPPTGVVERASTDIVVVDDTLVAAAVQMIRSRLGDDIGPEQIAHELGITRRTLDRRFLRSLDCTLREELLRVRMRRACGLLDDERNGVATIARRCGYGSAAAFSRAFCQHTGHWPSAFRDQRRQENQA